MRRANPGAIAATIVLIPSVAKAEWVMVAGNNDALFSVYDGKTVIRGRMAEFYAKLQRNSVNNYAKVTANCASGAFYLNELNPDGSLQLSKPVTIASPGSFIHAAIQHACR